MRVRASPLLSSPLLSPLLSHPRANSLRSASRLGGIPAVTRWEDNPLSLHALLLGSEAPFAAGSVRRIRRISRPSAHQGLEELRRHEHAQQRAPARPMDWKMARSGFQLGVSRRLRSMLRRDVTRPTRPACNGMPAGQGGKAPPFAWRVQTPTEIPYSRAHLLTYCTCTVHYCSTAVTCSISRFDHGAGRPTKESDRGKFCALNFRDQNKAHRQPRERRDPKKRSIEDVRSWCASCTPFSCNWPQERRFQWLLRPIREAVT